MIHDSYSSISESVSISRSPSQQSEESNQRSVGVRPSAWKPQPKLVSSSGSLSFQIGHPSSEAPSL